LFGHSHGTLPDDANALSIDVGVDCNNYFPFTFDQIKAKMDKKSFKPTDHHGETPTTIIEDVRKQVSKETEILTNETK